jgi:hypothetical protein
MLNASDGLRLTQTGLVGRDSQSLTWQTEPSGKDCQLPSDGDRRTSLAD